MTNNHVVGRNEKRRLTRRILKFHALKTICVRLLKLSYDFNLRNYSLIKILLCAHFDLNVLIKIGTMF